LKPIHGEFSMLRRCPCCQGKHSIGGARKKNSGKSSARIRIKAKLKKYDPKDF
jgi:hypothetical protein